MPIYEYLCEACKREWEEYRSVDDRLNVFCCGERAVKLIASGVRVSPDQMWNFNTKAFGKPVDIHSRGQYKKLLKQHGMADATMSECLSVKPSKDPNKNKRKALAKKIADRCYKDNVLKDVPAFMKAVYKVGKKTKGGSKNG